MDSKGCSLGREQALVSTPWAWALPWMITSLSGVTAAVVCVHVHVCMRACLGQDEGGGNWNRGRHININTIVTHQGSLHIFTDYELDSLLPPTAFRPLTLMLLAFNIIHCLATNKTFISSWNVAADYYPHLCIILNYCDRSTVLVLIITIKKHFLITIFLIAFSTFLTSFVFVQAPTFPISSLKVRR